MNTSSGVIVAAALALAACGGSPAPQVVERARAAMGSELRLTAYTTDPAGAGAAFDAVFSEFDRLDGLMSVWREGSDILRVNAAAGERPIVVSPEVREVLHAARQISEWTHGKFDVTFGAFADVWKFDAQNQDNTVPDDATIRARLPLIDYRRIEIDDGAGT